MKIKSIITLMCLGVATISLTSCLGDAKNYFTGGGAFATVVGSDMQNNTILELDGDAFFYSTETNSKEYKRGERVLVERFTLDRDNQPANASGEYKNPMLLTEVTSLKLDLKEYINNSGGSAGEFTQDTLRAFMAPRITKSYTNNYYMTFGGYVLQKPASKFNLYQDGYVNDTLVYTFAVEYIFPDEESKKSKDNKLFYHSFYIPPVASEQIVKVNFTSSEVLQSSPAYTFKDQTVTFKAPKYESEN